MNQPTESELEKLESEKSLINERREENKSISLSDGIINFLIKIDFFKVIFQ